jgi:hypothetical protein
MTTLRRFLLILCVLVCSNINSQERKIYNLRNCQNEARTTTFREQIHFLNLFVLGKSHFSDQNVLHFSVSYNPDTLLLNKQAQNIRKTLPSDFLSSRNPFGDWYDNVPDEKSIWFTQIFAEKDKQGNFKIYSAYKITFEGSNANEDNQRTNPKIKNIKFIMDKQSLLKLSEKLKSLSPL